MKKYHEGFYNQVELQDTKLKRWGYHICDSLTGAVVAFVFSDTPDTRDIIKALTLPEDSHEKN